MLILLNTLPELIILDLHSMSQVFYPAPVKPLGKGLLEWTEVLKAE
jgi:hypothetical protein